MKALVYHGPDQRGWDTVPDTSIVDPTDAIVRIDTSTICGSGLHILKGDVPEATAGIVLGPEAVGTVQEIGTKVTTVVPGDPLEDTMAAYDTFAGAASTDALKVVLSGSDVPAGTRPEMAAATAG